MARTASASTKTSTRGAGRKTAAAQGAAQTANTANLQQQGNPSIEQNLGLPERAAAVQSQGNPNKLPEGQPTPQQTNDANLKMPHVQHGVLVSEMKAATAGFKAALNLEIAVSCIVFADADSTAAAAKKELYSIYRDAGYDCDVGEVGKDYKTVNRRINNAAALFDFIEQKEKGKFKTLMGDARDAAAVQAVTAYIASTYNFRHMSEVPVAAGIQPRVPTPRQPGNNGGSQSGNDGQQGGGNGGGSAPQGGGTANQQQGQSVFRTSATANPTGTPTGTQPDAGDQGVMAAMDQARQEAGARERREVDDPSKWVTLTYEGATLVVPVGMKTDCLFQLGMRLMQAANEMHGAHTIVPAALKDQFKEAVAAH